MPVYALDPYLSINVAPSEISFNVVDAEEPEQYYSSTRDVTVISKHSFPWNARRWYVGIRSCDSFLKDSINPNNQIPISQLRWSLDGQNFQQLSQQWQLVNSYYDYRNKKYEETITYHLYPETNQGLPAGIYNVRIEFDVRWLNLPWQ